MMVNSNSTSKETFFFQISLFWSQGEGGREIQTSNLHFMRRGPQLIVLPLEVGHKKEKTRFKPITSTS